MAYTGFWNNYPGTNLHEIDLHYILMQIVEMRKAMQEVVESATITFADPITWNITSQYAAHTVVMDSEGNGYISQQPVPAGIPVSDTDYWQQIFNMSQITDDIAQEISDLRGNIAIISENGYAPQSLYRYDLVWINNDLYMMTTDVDAGTMLITGTNVTPYTVDQKFDLIEQQIEQTVEKPYYDCYAHGITPDLPDCSVLLNEVLADSSITENYRIYMRKGRYRATAPILIVNDGTEFTCDGEIQGTGSSVVNLQASDCDISIYLIRGDGNNNGLMLSCPLATIGNNIVEVHYISNTNYALYLYAEEHGIMNCVFRLNRFNRFTHGIHFYAGRTGAGFINENKFYDLWAYGYANTETAIFMEKGDYQSDWYNGNTFENFSFEGCYYFCQLEYAERNYFNNFRFLENYHVNALVLASDCKNNNFLSSDSRMIRPDFIQDAGKGNNYRLRFGTQYPNGTEICREATYYNGVFCPIGRTIDQIQSAGANSATQTALSYQKILLLTLTANTARGVYVLPECWCHPDTAPEQLLITTGSVTNGVEIQTPRGEAIVNSEGTGTHTTQLAAWQHYILTCTGHDRFSIMKMGAV